MLKHRLTQEGIDCFIFGEALQGGGGELQVMDFLKLMVDEADYDRARHLLLTWEQSDAGDALDAYFDAHGQNS